MLALCLALFRLKLWLDVAFENFSTQTTSWKICMNNLLCFSAEFVFICFLCSFLCCIEFLQHCPRFCFYDWTLSQWEIHRERKNREAKGSLMRLIVCVFTAINGSKECRASEKNSMKKHCRLAIQCEFYDGGLGKAGDIKKQPVMAVNWKRRSFVFFYALLPWQII